MVHTGLKSIWIYKAGFILGRPIAGFTLFFPDSAQILTWCETVPHPKFVEEMSETCARPLNVVNTHVFHEKETIFQCFSWKCWLWKALKIPCFLSGPLCLMSSQNHYWKMVCSVGMPAILKISVCRGSMPQMASLIGCMDIIHAHSWCALELLSSAFVNEAFHLGLFFTDCNIWPSKNSNGPLKMLKRAKHGPQNFWPGDKTENAQSKNQVKAESIFFLKDHIIPAKGTNCREYRTGKESCEEFGCSQCSFQDVWKTWCYHGESTIC